MTKPTTARTLIKIRVGRRGREWTALFAFIGGLFLALGLMAAMQVHYCRKAHPTADWLACLRPVVK